VILLDSGGLLALLDRGEPEHRRAHAAVKRARGPLILTDFVFTEVDYLVGKRLGRKAELAFVDQVIGGAFLREPVEPTDLRRAREILLRYAEHDLGVTDATLMALCDRLGTHEVLTLDHRHFAPYRSPRGEGLRLLP
jgi:predicted nucleic acid-binding protein